MTFWTILLTIFSLSVLYLLGKVLAVLVGIESGIKYLGECSRSDTDRMNELLTIVDSNGGSLGHIEGSLRDIESTLTNIDVKLPLT